MQKHNEEVCILLGVWGERFIHDFFQFSLASLLAPGNIPALAKQYKTRFIFLTRALDIEVFENHPAFKKLQEICSVEFINVSDLIVVGNYSTTLTLAYDRAVRSQGEAMLNTYFIFLTSDYIMADGSFEGLMRYMQRGYSGIQAGNFQVTQEDVEEYLLEQINPDTHVMQIKPRDLLKHCIDHLHPITTTSFIDQNIAHNYYANRFFYRDNDIIGGRFYLLHMLCIKPETMNYQVGASCDYSFIPEMCPSGNIATILDSDNYLVVEVQSKQHELSYIQWGPYNQYKLVKALSGWTTAGHRQNASQTIFYHCQDLSLEQRKKIEDALSAFLSPLAQALSRYKTMPFRNHPYWIGAISTHENHQKLIQNIDHHEEFDTAHARMSSIYRKLFHQYFGAPPSVFRWHFRWREYTSVTNKIKQFVADDSASTFAVYSSDQLDFMRYSVWLKDKLNINKHLNAQNMIQSQKIRNTIKNKEFSKCLIFTRLEDFKKLLPTLRILENTVTPNLEILLVIINSKNHLPTLLCDIRREFAFRMNDLLATSYQIKNITTIHDNFSLIGNLAIEQINLRFSYNKILRFMSYILLGLPGTAICCVRNFLSRNHTDKKSGHCTNIIINLTRDTRGNI